MHAAAANAHKNTQIPAGPSRICVKSRTFLSAVCAPAVLGEHHYGFEDFSVLLVELGLGVVWSVHC